MFALNGRKFVAATYELARQESWAIRDSIHSYVPHAASGIDQTSVIDWMT